MASATVRWITKGQFLATDSSKHSVVLSTQDEENGIGMKPSELLLAAVGGCGSVDVVSILQKKRQKLTGLEVHVNGQQWSIHRGRSPRSMSRISCMGRVCPRRPWPMPSGSQRRSIAR